MEKHSVEIITLTDSNADSFLLKFLGTPRSSYILIDGGLRHNGKRTLEFFNDIIQNDGYIDLVILTHVDLDHINGLLTMFESEVVNANTIGGILFNVPHSEQEIDDIKYKLTQCGYKEGNRLLELILKNKIIIHNATQGNIFSIENNVEIEILSPTQSALDTDHDNWRDTNIGHDESDDYNKEELLKEKHKEDIKPQNVSSISCLITHNEKKLLFCGDSVPSQILGTVDTITAVNFFKVPHHGSKYNVSYSLFEKFPCNTYLIPGSRGAYPNFYTIALLEEQSPLSTVYVPKESWVHSDRYKNQIKLSFNQYEIGTRILL